MRGSWCVLVIGVLAFVPPAVGQTVSKFQVHGYFTAREIYAKAPLSWTEGGFGRFDVGAGSGDEHRLANLDLAQVGLDWEPFSWLQFHADGLGRHEPSGTGGKRFGIVQGYADLHNDHWRLRAGSFWLPTSRENVDSMWNSRYTISYSALNSWIGQEVRPVGLDLQYSPNFYVTAGITAFRGNDTMGTALSARGWTVGNRISVYNEEIPLPPPDLVTKAVGHDLDGRNGYAARVRLQLPERAMVQLTHIDNRAELVPEIRGQEPWLTRFDIVGAEVGSTSPTTLAGEWARGNTSVAFTGGSFKLDFATAYLLLSHKTGPDRWSARVERFTTNAHDPRPIDGSRESGDAVTVAWLHDTTEHLRLGLEYAHVRGDRPGAIEAGFNPEVGGSTLTAELRYGF